MGTRACTVAGLVALALPGPRLVTAPHVSTTPPASAVADGAEIGDDVRLGWYGQGNGAPSPSS